MRFVVYAHSLVSCWNHGNAHFLRGLVRALQARGHTVAVLEPAEGWSLANLLADQGRSAVHRFAVDFPTLVSTLYAAGADHAALVDGADVVLVHEWTDPAVVATLGRLRRAGGRFTLLFHDTHHRAVSAEGDIAGLDLSDYDGVLAFGETLRQRYLAAGWGRQVFTWHEAADTALFRPMPEIVPTRDLVWVGNWGDGERTAELETFLIEPVRLLGLSATVRGVRYPAEAKDRLAAAGLAFEGWVANADVPALFARHRVTVHVPRRPYVESLPCIPTIRMFEALASGIPLVSAPWEDAEGLFRRGADHLLARDGAEMRRHLATILADRDLAAALSRKGLATIRARHTCGHRADELLAIVAGLSGRATGPALAGPEAAEPEEVTP